MILFRYYSIILSLNNTAAEIAAKGDRFIMQYTTDKIRNICLLGHGGDGKSALAEALLYFTGSTDRLGTAAQGNTVSDFDPEEIKRQISISTSVIPVEWKGKKINLLDTPGYFDFEGEVLQKAVYTSERPRQ